MSLLILNFDNFIPISLVCSFNFYKSSFSDKDNEEYTFLNICASEDILSKIKLIWALYYNVKIILIIWKIIEKIIKII